MFELLLFAIGCHPVGAIHEAARARRVSRRKKRMRAGRETRPEKRTKQRRFYISCRRGFANGGSLRIEKTTRQRDKTLPLQGGN
jgi:hypothetical protein